MVRTGKIFLSVVLGFLLLLLMVEGTLRLLYSGMPTIPFYTNSRGTPSLYPDDSILVSFPDQREVRYTTNTIGARIAYGVTEDEKKRRVDTFVIGDSQALGYGLPLDKTFGYLTNQTIHQNRNVQIYASPSTDVELLSYAVCTEPNMKALTPRTLIVVANLGNDMDEIYLGGRTPRGTPSPNMHKTLLRYSRLYMRLAIARSRQALQAHALPGVNPILFNLSTTERVILADQIIDRIKKIFSCVPGTDSLILVLMPSDFQVEADELLKYRKYSNDKKLFAEWSDRRAQLASMMTTLEKYIMTRLKTEPISIISFRELVAEKSLESEQIFERTSHHITPLGHRILADEIAARIMKKQ